MKKYLISMIVLLVIGAIICGGGAIVYAQSDNRIFEKDLEYTQKEYVAESEINAIDFSLMGAYNFILQRGDTCSVSYYESEISHFTVLEEEGTLKMQEKYEWKNTITKWCNKQQKTDFILTVPEGVVLSMDCHFSGAVTLELPEWEYGDINMKLSGATTLSSESPIKADQLNFDVSGVLTASLKGEFDSINLKVSGSSSMTFDGSAKSIIMKSSGATNFNSNELVCPEINVNASGSAKITLNGEGKEFNAHASGYCSIDAGTFTLDTLSINASGAVNMTVNVKDEINSHASGSVKVDYYGDPKISTSGSSKAKYNKIG